MPFSILPLLLCCDLPRTVPPLVIKPGQTAIFVIKEERLFRVRTRGLPASGEFRASLTFDNGRTVLHVVNNSGTALNYHAVAKVRGKWLSGITECTVNADTEGSYKTWPVRIREVRILAFMPATEGEIPCE